MEKQPKVSIIIPVYNTKKYLSKCLESVVNQTLDDTEIIIVDDKSTDGSVDIEVEYAKRYPNISLICLAKNGGVALARNIGLQNAKGKYISFVDSDDYLDLDMLEKMYIACEETKSPVARVNRKLVTEGIDVSFLSRAKQMKGYEVIIPEESDLLVEETPGCTNKLFLREFVKGRTFPENLKWEDYPYTVPILATSPQVVSVPDTNYNYNINLGGTTVSDFTTFNSRILDIFECSDLIGEAVITERTPDTIKEQLEYVAMINAMQRLRDILYSNIPKKDKKELMTLVTALITKKYGSWHDNDIYNSSKKKLPYRLRMKLIEYFIEPYDASMETEESLKQKIKNKSETIKKNAD